MTMPLWWPAAAAHLRRPLTRCPVDAIGKGLTDAELAGRFMLEVEEQLDVDRRREPRVVVRRVLGRVELVDTRDVLAAPLRLVVGEVEVGGIVVVYAG